MTELTFRLLVAVTAVIAIGSEIAEVVGARSLPYALRSHKAQVKVQTVASSKAHPFHGFVRIALVVGYLSSLGGLFFFVILSPWFYLFFTVGWSVISFLDAPHVISRAHSIFYESSLLLNGCLLGLCFLSPLSARFA